MITKKIASITIVIALAAMFFSSSAFVNPSLAKTTDKSTSDTASSKSKDKSTTKDDPTTNTLTTDTTSTTDSSKPGDQSTTKDDPTTGTSSSAKSDFKEFQKCLSDAAGTKGFATNKEIKACYSPIFIPASSSTTTTHLASSPHSTTTVKPIDFSTPQDFSQLKNSIKFHNSNDDSKDNSK